MIQEWEDLESEAELSHAWGRGVVDVGRAFPTGFDIVAASSVSHGMNAIIDSMRFQYPEFNPPTAELLEIRTSRYPKHRSVHRAPNLSEEELMIVSFSDACFQDARTVRE